MSDKPNEAKRSEAVVADAGRGDVRQTRKLANATSLTWVRIVATHLDDDEIVAWLAAVGLSQGEEVMILRRAILGGPLHVRTASGGEFAVAREIAVKLEVTTHGGGGEKEP